MTPSNRSSEQVRFAQVYAHHPRGTLVVLAGKFASGAELGIALIQEPWIYR